MSEHNTKLVELVAIHLWKQAKDCPSDWSLADEETKLGIRCIAAAALEAIEAQGFVIAPAEPTHGMVEAGVAAIRDFRRHCQEDGSNIAILDNPVALSAVAVRAALATLSARKDASQ